jgi:hypothetical protein
MRKNNMRAVYSIGGDRRVAGALEGEICSGVKGNMGGIKEVMDVGGREEGLNGVQGKV